MSCPRASGDIDDEALVVPTMAANFDPESKSFPYGIQLMRHPSTGRAYTGGF